MKSWIHEIAESYVSTHKPVRRDLKENYVQLNEEQKFGLLSENVLNYLDEQLRNAYGVGVNDLTEEQLNELLGGLAALAGRAVGGIARGAGAVKQGVKRAGSAVAGALAKPVKSMMDTYASGEIARAGERIKRGEAVQSADTLRDKLGALVKGKGQGVKSAFQAGMGSTPKQEETPEAPEEEPTQAPVVKMKKQRKAKPGCD